MSNELYLWEIKVMTDYEILIKNLNHILLSPSKWQKSDNEIIKEIKRLKSIEINIREQELFIMKIWAAVGDDNLKLTGEEVLKKIRHLMEIKRQMMMQDYKQKMKKEDR